MSICHPDDLLAKSMLINKNDYDDNDDDINTDHLHLHHFFKWATKQNIELPLALRDE